MLDARVAGALGSEALASVRSYVDPPEVLPAVADLASLPVTVALDLLAAEVAANAVVLGVGHVAIAKGNSAYLDDVRSERA